MWFAITVLTVLAMISWETQIGELISAVAHRIKAGRPTPKDKS